LARSVHVIYLRNMQFSANSNCIHFSFSFDLPGQVKLCESASGGLFAVKICRCSFFGTQTQRNVVPGGRGARRMSISGQDKLEALKKEISIMKRLDHPNIVKLHHVLEDTVKGKVCSFYSYPPSSSLCKFCHQFRSLRCRCTW